MHQEPRISKCPLGCCRSRNPEREDCRRKVMIVLAKQKAQRAKKLAEQSKLKTDDELGENDEDAKI